jgi:hypothetical protein
MIDDKLVKKVVEESIDKAINEGFEDGTTLEGLIMKLYDFGADLNINKDMRNISIPGIGSVIMTTAQKMLELVKNQNLTGQFKNEFSRNVQKFGNKK